MARRARTTYLAEIRQAGYPGGDWMARFMAEGPDVFTESSGRAYLAVWRTFLAYLAHLGCSPMTATAGHIADYLATLETPATRQRYGRLLARVYAFVSEHGITAHNPMDALQPQLKETVGRSAPVALPMVELVPLFETLPPPKSPKDLRDRAMVALLLGAGLRLKELREFRLSQLIETPEGLTVRLSGGTVKGRTLVLDPLAATTLRAWRDLRRADEVAGALLFPGTAGEAMPANTVYRRILHTVAQMRGLDLPLRLSPGVLRTTFARRLLKHQTSTAAQYKLGHRLLGSTLRLGQAPSDGC